MKSIKIKLVIYFSGLLLAFAVLFSVSSYINLAKVMTSNAEEVLELMAGEGTNLAKSRIETQISTLETIAARDSIISMNWDEQKLVLDREFERLNFLALAIVYPDGTAFYNDGTTAQLGDRDYVTKAFKGQSNLSDVIISRVTNQPVLMYAVPILSKNKTVGVLIARGNGNVLSDLTRDLGYKKSGYAYILNDEGTVIAHHNRQLVLDQFNPISLVKEDDSLSSLANMFETMVIKKEGVGEYRFNGIDLYVGYRPIDGTQWILGITAPVDEVLEDLNGIRNSFIVITLIGLILALILVTVIGNYIAKPILLVTKQAELLASLNISVDNDNKLLSRKDEIGRLALSFNSLTHTLRGFIKSIGQSSEQLASASQQLTATAQQSTVASEEVAKTVEEIARSANHQAQDTEQGSFAASKLGALIENEQQYLQELNIAADTVISLKEEGFKTIDELIKKTEKSKTATQEVSDVIRETHDSSEKISASTKMIQSIADQTNLLALNAAIEAARAGEAGRGFAVVADEIRKLAEQSNKFTLEIDEIVKDLQTKANSAVVTTEYASKTIDEQNRSVLSTQQKFEGIAVAIGKTKDVINKLNLSGREMEDKKDEILDLIQNMSAIAEENAAATQEASASSEELTASMEELSNSSQSLTYLAQELQKISARFQE